MATRLADGMERMVYYRPSWVADFRAGEVPAELERRRQEGLIRMIQVQDSRLNRLRVQTSALAAQPVARDDRGEVLP